MIREYLFDHLLLTVFNSVLCLVLALFLIAVGLPIHFVIMIVVSWILIYSTYSIIQYYHYQQQKKELESIMSTLKQQYLITSIIKEPSLYTQKLYYTILTKATKSMHEEIALIKQERNEYQEYIENWVHEIKTPISAILLITQNNEDSYIKNEIEKINYLVEQALFFARSDFVENDYFIHEVQLESAIHPTLMSYQSLLLMHHFELDVDSVAGTVYTDEKWLTFILDQIVANAIKYKREDVAFLAFKTRTINNGIALTIEDHGQGIEENDISRVFNKGFTGKNRGQQEATGLGLYLVKKLCTKLGINITIESQINNYTRVTLMFSKGTLHKWDDER